MAMNLNEFVKSTCCMHFYALSKTALRIFLELLIKIGILPMYSVSVNFQSVTISDGVIHYDLKITFENCLLWFKSGPIMALNPALMCTYLIRVVC